METIPGEYEIPSWIAWSTGLAKAPEVLLLNEQQTRRKRSEAAALDKAPRRNTPCQPSSGEAEAGGSGAQGHP